MPEPLPLTPPAHQPAAQLTKRELFAALALAGLASRDFPADLCMTAEGLAAQAVVLADALLARLARG